MFTLLSVFLFSHPLQSWTMDDFIKSICSLSLYLRDLLRFFSPFQITVGIQTVVKDQAIGNENIYFDEEFILKIADSIKDSPMSIHTISKLAQKIPSESQISDNPKRI